jgi:hypothetical protein
MGDVNLVGGKVRCLRRRVELCNPQNQNFKRLRNTNGLIVIRNCTDGKYTFDRMASMVNLRPITQIAVTNRLRDGQYLRRPDAIHHRNRFPPQSGLRRPVYLQALLVSI